MVCCFLLTKFFSEGTFSKPAKSWEAKPTESWKSTQSRHGILQFFLYAWRIRTFKNGWNVLKNTIKSIVTLTRDGWRVSIWSDLELTLVGDKNGGRIWTCSNSFLLYHLWNISQALLNWPSTFLVNYKNMSTPILGPRYCQQTVVDCWYFDRLRRRSNPIWVSDLTPIGRFQTDSVTSEVTRVTSSFIGFPIYWIRLQDKGIKKFRHIHHTKR